MDVNYGDKDFMKLKTHASSGRIVYTGYTQFQVAEEEAPATTRRQLEDIRSLVNRGYPLSFHSATLSLLALRTCADTEVYHVNESFSDAAITWSNEPPVRQRLHRKTGIEEGWLGFNVR